MQPSRYFVYGNDIMSLSKFIKYSLWTHYTLIHLDTLNVSVHGVQLSVMGDAKCYIHLIAVNMLMTAVIRIKQLFVM